MLSSISIPRESISIISKLGEGNFGEVFEASAIGLREHAGPVTVAIKALRSTATVEDQLEFMREATRQSKLDHPNIVRLLAVCLDGLPLLLLEYMARGDLKSLLSRPEACPRLVDSPSKLHVCIDLASALEYLEQLGYVHRDIAARNVLVNNYWIPKFGDFGLSFFVM
jgi:serine/threonine protein kinase